MFDAKRLHPLAAVLNAFKHLKELIFPFVAFVVFGSRNSNWDLFYLVASLGVLVFVLIFGVISWMRFTYRVEEGELRIEHGVFVRKKRYIPFERIQSLDVSEGLLHRPFGLVKIKVETAGTSGGHEAEAVLSAITKMDAAHIQELLLSAKSASKKIIEIADSTSSVVYKISPSELLLLGSTSGGVGVVLSAVIALISQLEDIIPFRRIFKGFEQLISNGLFMISILALIGFLIAWTIALLGTMVKYANFTVVRNDEDLVISRGLLEKRQMTIPLKRIQAIRISENVIRQMFGYATVYVDSAGGSVKDKESSRVMVLPFVKKARITELIASHFVDYKMDVPFKVAPKRSLIRYILRALLFVFPVVVSSLIFLRPWGYLSIVLLAASVFWAYINFKDAGWSIENNQLSLRYRNLLRTTVFMRKSKIQSVSVKESFFQKKKDLATIQSFVKSGVGGSGGSVSDLEEKDVYHIYKWYSSED